MDRILSAVFAASETEINVYLGFLRIAAPVLALLLLLRVCMPLLTFRREPEIWAWLCLRDGKKLPITHWENVIGRHKRSDIVIDFPTISRNHAVITRYDDGSWTITDSDSKSGILLNGKPGKIFALEPEDVITIGGIDMQLQPISRKQEQRLAQLRTKAASFWSSLLNVILLTAFQILCCWGLLLGGGGDHGKDIVIGFGGLIVCQWVLLLFYALIRRPSFEVETIAFFLSTMGMAAIATVVPEESVKQLISVVLGIVVFIGCGWSLRDLERAKKIRYLATAAGVAFLVITLLLGREINGAKNWLIIGGMSLQPSELSKVCFVFAGASTMDRLVKKRNLILFIAYSVLICGCLALMRDFGTALIFFCGFLVIAYLRSGSVGTVGLAITSLVFAGVMVLKIMPHALGRFENWRHIWEAPLDGGYQQTRSLMCMVSGGLFGMGANQGWMENLFAADSDMVFATITEEWGLILAVMMIAAVIALALFVVRSTAVGRSSFYTIGACTAVAILLVQTILNALGTVDVVPLTGVTFPFVSNGGSSMIGAWGLLAFVKAADTRQNGSFAVRLNRNRGDANE